MQTGQLGITGLIRICSLILALILSISLCAQSRQGRTNTNTASAVLHIHVNVVPAVLPPQPQPRTTQSPEISYIIPIVNTQNQTIVQESQLTSSTNCAAVPCSGVLRTTTVIAY